MIAWTTTIRATAAKLLFAGGLLGIGIAVTGQITPGQVITKAATPAVRAKAAPSPTAQPTAVVPAALTAADLEQGGEFVVKRILTLDQPLSHGDYAWDEEGVPQGPIVITVDLAAETISVFRDGYEIGAAAILYGVDSNPTPLGVFPITQKDADHVSNIYDAPMPYMLRLTNDGVAIHGSTVEWGSGSRGCIGVPIPFAKLLFGQVKLGDIVIITNGKMLDLGQQIIGA